MKITMFLLVILSLVTSWYVEISILLFLILFFRFINSAGKKLLLMETISLYSCLIYLIIPLMGFRYYSISNALSRLWVTYMKVPESVYFDYTLPAILIFVFALILFEKRHEGEVVKKILEQAKDQLLFIGNAPYFLVMTGLVAFYLRNLAPASLTFVLTILFLSVFAGISYLFFNHKINFKGKLIIGFFVLWIMYNAVLSAMFTIVVYMGISFFGLLMLNKRFSFMQKLIGMIFLLGFTMVLQFSKANYRLLGKRNLIRGSAMTTFVRVYVQNLFQVKDAFNIQAFFPIFVRTNQGYQLASVMHHIPAHKPHDNGDLLGKSLLASLVPRAVWPNKPESGGKINMMYYANTYLDTTSMNVGPIGEGYGAFGKWGGIFYMLLFGTFLSLAFRFFLSLARRRPLLLFWQPLIFYEVIFCMENDTMQALNSLIKITVFLFLVFKLFPGLISPRKKAVSPQPLAYG